MKLTGEDLQGKQVVVVDEAIFMGTTLRIVCQMLREAGAAKAHIAIPTPMSNCRCAQYVLPAMPSLADSMPPSKILDYFGAEIEKSVSRAACAGYVFHAVVLWISTKL